MRKLMIVLTMAAATACQVDEAPQPSNNSVGAGMLKQLTDGTGNSKSWRIASATMTTNSVTLDITDLPNVKDDELVFGGDVSGAGYTAGLTWKVRNEVRAGASKIEDVLEDYYLSARKSQINISSKGKITTGDSNLKVESISESEVSLRYTKGDSELALTLSPLSDVSIPSSLSFEKISEITGPGIEQAAGFTGSMTSNSLYIAYKPLYEYGERVVKYDITNDTYASRDFSQPDFVTKEIHIMNDTVKVVGGQYVNTYTLDLDRIPVSNPHNLQLTRFGSTVVDKNIYLFGGDFDKTNTSKAEANRIYRHDQKTGQLVKVGSLPESRYWSHGEIVDGKLYVFGGKQSFSTDIAEDDIFIWDIKTDQTQTLKLPKAMGRTFAARQGHLIYVAGQVFIPGETPETNAYETIFGVFDTYSKTFEELPTSLAAVGRETVYGFTIVGDNMYILYGSTDNYTFSIYKAPL